MTALVKSQPVHLSVQRARDLLAKARSHDEVKHIRDVAVAMRAYANTQQDCRAIAIDAGEIILRADARMGQLASQLPKAAHGGRGGGSESPKRGPSLADLKLSKQRASEMQRAASLPTRDLDRYLAASRKAKQPPSTSAVVALAQLPPPKREKVLATLGDKPDVAKAIQRARAEVRQGARVERIDKQARGNRPLETRPEFFPIVLADPPWRYESGTTDPSREIENQYPTMKLADICAMPVQKVITEDAILFLWHPPGMATEAVQVATAWGFRERSSWVWVKPSIGPGYWGRLRHEMLLICTRGKFPAPLAADRLDSVIEAPRGRHSAKPAEVAERIERMYPSLPKLELFCRAPRDGWHVFGNEAGVAAA